MQQSEPVSDTSRTSLSGAALFAIHDLKGAVHAIQGFLSVLRSQHAGPLTETQQDFLSSAFITARRIERLVGDLQVYEFGQQSLSLIPEDCDLLTILRMCIRELEPTATGYDVSVELCADANQNWRLFADPVRLEQIAFNLIENAIRYSTPHSTVVVRTRQSRSRLLLVVENEVADPTGINLERLFEPFQRGQAASESGRRGLGIGMTVVKTLVAARGGDVYARVRGTTVSIAASLPRRSPAVAASSSGSDSAVTPGTRARTLPTAQARSGSY
ncbi:MAG TPA: HAMP domain-containing sensor histidine kinase [Thermomicrobiales bacterium]|nr:HAMP domain-containing sensor histidine kinase [Thermomicrobiales bacterium]